MHPRSLSGLGRVPRLNAKKDQPPIRPINRQTKALVYDLSLKEERDAMPNSIPTIQNEDAHLKQLAAQRRLYSEAKTTLAWQMIFTMPVPIASSFVAIVFDS